MQKVDGSSPFIRFEKHRWKRTVFCSRSGGRNGELGPPPAVGSAPVRCSLWELAKESQEQEGIKVDRIAFRLGAW
jgi:hypothetical protein